MPKRTRLPLFTAATVTLVLAAGSAAALDKVTLGTNWKAEAEHGCFYQALATGIYKDYGLDVTIRQGGPQVNHPQLLIAGRIDFNIGNNSFDAMNYAAQKIPMITVASMFQKDPQVLIAHPGQGNDTLPGMKGKPVMISSAARNGYWQFLKVRYGFTDDQLRPYNFNLAPFLADKTAIVQGYVTSEVFAVQKAGIQPAVVLLADAGFSSYSTTIETSQKLVDQNPDLVQRFVDASIKGCYSYMTGDPAPANTLIKKDNPEMSDELLAYGISSMKQYGIVDSGDSKTLGVGAMTDARWADFWNIVSSAGVYPKDMDWKRGYTLRFVNKKVGLVP